MRLGLGRSGRESTRPPERARLRRPSHPRDETPVPTASQESLPAQGGGDQKQRALISSRWVWTERRCPRLVGWCPGVVRRRGLGRVGGARYPCCPGSIPVWPGIQWSQSGAGPGFDAADNRRLHKPRCRGCPSGASPSVRGSTPRPPGLQCAGLRAGNAPVRPECIVVHLPSAARISAYSGPTPKEP